MNAALLLVALLAGSPPPPAVPPAARIPRDSARLLARFAENPSGFNPCFGRSDPGAHVARFGGAAPAGAGPATARDKALEAALYRPRINTTLQMSVQWKGN